jgi:hypothetical protein
MPSKTNPARETVPSNFVGAVGDDCGAGPELAAGDPEPDGRQHGADPGRLP